MLPAEVLKTVLGLLSRDDLDTMLVSGMFTHLIEDCFKREPFRFVQHLAIIFCYKTGRETVNVGTSDATTNTSDNGAVEFLLEDFGKRLAMCRVGKLE